MLPHEIMKDLNWTQMDLARSSVATNYNPLYPPLLRGNSAPP